LWLAAQGEVHAQDREVPEEAIQHYEQGREDFVAGRYREAIDHLEEALRLDPESATLTYNLARVHELLGEMETALEYYRRYLERLSPDDPERESTESTIRRITGALEQRQDETPAPIGPSPAEPQPPRDSEPHTGSDNADALFWLVGSGSVVLFAAGAVTGALALGKESQAQQFALGSDGDLDDWVRTANAADNLALATDLLLVAGGAALVSAVLLLTLRGGEPEEPNVSAGVTADDSGALFTLRGRL
jgi:tetratricopeptide (TPR) repeat protein